MVRDPKGHLNWVRLPFSTFVRRGQRFVGFVFPLFFGANRAWQEYIYIYVVYRSRYSEYIVLVIFIDLVCVAFLLKKYQGQKISS